MRVSCKTKKNINNNNTEQKNALSNENMNEDK